MKADKIDWTVKGAEDAELKILQKSLRQVIFPALIVFLALAISSSFIVTALIQHEFFRGKLMLLIACVALLDVWLMWFIFKNWVKKPLADLISQKVRVVRGGVSKLSKNDNEAFKQALQTKNRLKLKAEDVAICIDNTWFPLKENEYNTISSGDRVELSLSMFSYVVLSVRKLE